MTSQMPALGRPPSSQPNGGTITGQQRTVEPGPNNTVVPGYRVEFKTAKGALGSVFLPEAQYTGASAIAAARQAANELDIAHGSAI